MVEGHFGLLPGFAKDAKFGWKTYNARSETVRELASFKGAWAKPPKVTGESGRGRAARPPRAGAVSSRDSWRR